MNKPTTHSLTPNDYLKKILAARVYDVAKETSLDYAKNLSARIGHTVLLKREDQQPVFSFKLRGAYNKMVQLTPAQLKKGVICASAGNHAQGVALGAKTLGTRAIIVMPTTTPSVKVDAVRALGGEVVLFGESYSEASLHAQKLQAQKGLTFIHPFDDPDVIAGQGTIGLEILRQVQGTLSQAKAWQSSPAKKLDAVFVAIGGGGLISGVANCIKAIDPSIRVIGVQADDSDAMMQSVAAGKRVTLPDVGLFADGTAVKLVGEETFRIASSGLIDEFMTVNTDAICAAIKDIYVDTRSIVEPSGALAVAAIKQYAQKHKRKAETYAAILCGANMNFDRLRFVAERADVGEHKEAIFAVTVPEERGSFKRFCTLVGAGRSITEFNYRMSDAKIAHVFVGLSTSTADESKKIAKALSKEGFKAIDLTHDELAKEHIRYMVGGASSLAVDERVLRFTFPERPGALLKFLSAMQPSWNISLFHYRNQGADYGRILVGIQVPTKESKAFDAFLKNLGYPFVEETTNPAYQLFLQA
jgi:threonine dehydratase